MPTVLRAHNYKFLAPNPHCSKKFVYDLLNTSHKLCPDSMLFLLTENITVLTNI